MDMDMDTKIYKPNERKYNVWGKDGNDWWCVSWGTLDDCYDFMKSMHLSDKMYIVMPVGYEP